MQATTLPRIFNAVKAAYPKAIALFRNGDFYEAFEHDAVILNEQFKLPLVTEGVVSKVGFPHFGLDQYLPKIVRAGFKVALVDEIDEHNGKGVSFNLSTAEQ